MRPSTRLRFTALLTLPSLLFAACADDDETDSPSALGNNVSAVQCTQVEWHKSEPSDFADFPDLSQDLLQEPKVHLNDCDLPPSDLRTVDLIKGTGPAVPSGAEVTVNYVGVTFPEGEQFDSSWERNEPISFPLDRVITGWQEGIPGMQVGGRRVLLIPSDLAYEKKGFPPTIGPDHALVFVVDLLAYDDSAMPSILSNDGNAPKQVSFPSEKIPAAISKKPVIAVNTQKNPPKAPVVEDLVLGTGATVQADSTIVTNMLTILWSTGKENLSTWDSSAATEIDLSSEFIVEGLAESIQGMKVGGRRKIILPPDARAPRQETIIYVIDVLEIKS